MSCKSVIPSKTFSYTLSADQATELDTKGCECLLKAMSGKVLVFAKNDKISGVELAEKLRDEGILIRRFNKERIFEYVRISIGTPEQMQTVVKKIEKILGGK
jgi:histidinol-phosphate/aromatic aminotransferase/cobyric acid decarboxylase-like protein